MPVAIHIPAHTSQLGAASIHAPGKVSASDSTSAQSGSVSGLNFGALFREKAVAVAPVAEGEIPAAAKGTKAQAALEAEKTSDVTSDGAGTGQVDGGISDLRTAMPTGSSQALLEQQLQNALHAVPGGQNGAVFEVAGPDVSIVSSGKADGGKSTPNAMSNAKRASGHSRHEASALTPTPTAGASLPISISAAGAPVSIIQVAPVKQVPVTIETADTAGTVNPKAVVASVSQGISGQSEPTKSDAATSIAPEAHDALPNVAGLDRKDAAAVQAAPDASGIKTADDAKSSTKSIVAGQHGTVQAPAEAKGLSVSTASIVAPVTHGSDGTASAARIAQPAAVASTADSAAAPATSVALDAAGNAYDRIDQGVAPVVLHSGAQHVAVGVEDPSLGWVEIKTQNLGGHVEATLVTASGLSHDTLAAQLPAMAQFLEQRDVRVGSLAVHHELPGMQSNVAGNGAGSGTGYGAGGNANYGGAGAHHSGSESLPALTRVSPGISRVAAVPVSGISEDAALRPVSYISVRA